jgi:hypothetical protein
MMTYLVEEKQNAILKKESAIKTNQTKIIKIIKTSLKINAENYKDV